MTITPNPTGLFAIEPKARATDPQTSKDAAKAAEPVATGQARMVLAAIIAHPGRTASELAALIDGMDRHQIGRRTSDLKGKGLIEVGEPRAADGKRTKETTWYAKEDA